MAAPSTEGYAQGWLEYEKILGQRPILGESAESIIEAFNALGASLAAQAPPPDTSILVRDDVADGVPVRIYTPPVTSGTTSLPIGVYYHGGGYLVGNLDSEDAWCRYICKAAPCILVSVDYRLSTVAKLPAQLEDSVKAYRWVYKNTSKIGGNQDKMFTIGASAGGGLALTVADQLVKSGDKDKIQGVVAMVPVTAHPESIPSEYASEYTAYKDNASGVPIIDADSMRIFFEAADANYHDEKVFVTLSKNLKDLPPVYIATCGKDPLRDDGKVLELMLKKEGVKTKRDHYEGVPHYFWLFPGVDRGVEFLENVSKAVVWVLSQ